MSILRLFPEAWDHRRHRVRRRRQAAVALLGVAVAALLVVLPVRDAAPGEHPPRPEPARTFEVSPSRVLAGTPYMGVRCAVPNSIACDRVGLAIMLRTPAVSVSATIAGAPFAMNRFGDRLVSSRHPRREFDGYLQPAGIVSRLHVPAQHGMWFGDGDPSALVRLTIHEASGRTLTTRLRVTLAAGWG